ncbi:MAG: alpha/beta fold hydrolase [Planctomycetaceae bacterium]
MRFARRMLMFFVVISAVFAWFQRSMMYPAERAERLGVYNYPETTQLFFQAADLELVSGNNETIRGWSLQAAEQRSDRLIIFFHGNGSHRARRTSWYELCRSFDADVLAIDYRGYGDSDGKPSETALTQDAAATWKHATEVLKFHPSQIIIVGESLGGGVSVKLASTICQQGQAPAGLVLVSTFSSMVDAASYHFPLLPVRLLLLDRYRSDLEIRHVTSPVLQFHGTNDSVVPLPLAQRLHDATPATANNGIEKQLFIFEGAEHNNLISRHGVELQAAIDKWIRTLSLRHGVGNQSP